MPTSPRTIIIRRYPSRSALRHAERLLSESGAAREACVVSAAGFVRWRLGMTLVHHGLPWTDDQRRELRLAAAGGSLGVDTGPAALREQATERMPEDLVRRTREAVGSLPRGAAVLLLVVDGPMASPPGCLRDDGGRTVSTFAETEAPTLPPFSDAPVRSGVGHRRPWGPFVPLSST
ncbi:hypothetical protein GCM10010472_02470 [Pseudonocardia halophobica]|uniref:Uncharacterized protein n=1 Tax=Pseudonocardia halophobica TaxID=29401 RepID=A0A9W6NVN4_9PSEU|nr:hypothetical protein [Pseudonocardia halophobica]GLL10587.1 hypothetical protein GCM10017577_17270 [Pseudonocardia halophobica]